MKKKLIIIFGMALLLQGFIMVKGSTAEAASNNTSGELKIIAVSDIDVYNEYDSGINQLYIDTSYSNASDGVSIYKLKLNQDGYVKILLSSRLVFKYVTRIGSNSTTNVNYATVTATVYRDPKLLYSVMPSVTATGDSKGESVQKYALDKGTYYVALKTDKFSETFSGNTYNSTCVKGTADFLVYYQPVSSDETKRPSSVGNENKLSIGDTFKGMLTIPNAKDYYKFILKDRSLLKIKYMYDSKNSVRFILYGSNREELLRKNSVGNNVLNDVQIYLEPGTYYCSMETTTKNDGGRTNLLVNQIVYPLEVKQVNKSSNSYINIKTIEHPKEIRYIKGDMSLYELSSNKWKNGTVITDEKTFGVNEKGYYTVRVTDDFNNYFMETIKVNQCDKKPPKMPTIKSYKAGNIIISGTAEKETKIIVTVNNRQYTCNADSKGKYSCDLSYILSKGNKIEVVSQDISGNISNKAVTLVK